MCWSAAQPPSCPVAQPRLQARPHFTARLRPSTHSGAPTAPTSTATNPPHPQYTARLHSDKLKNFIWGLAGGKVRGMGMRVPPSAVVKAGGVHPPLGVCVHTEL